MNPLMTSAERKRLISFMLREEADRAQKWAEGLRQIARVIDVEAAQEGTSEDAPTPPNPN